MFNGLASHWWVILIIVVLLFGAPKLPALARSMGQSLKIFKNEMKSTDDESTPTNGVAATSTDKTTSADPIVTRQSGDTSSKP